MAKKIRRSTIDCACVIHGDYYSWDYVDRLYRGLCRNLTPKVILHVYTEAGRPVPEPYVKHSLTEWPGVSGPKKSWWYKIQLFDSDSLSADLLYFDLDTVIVSNIDWIWLLKPKYFWAVRDFKYLFRSKRATANSSIMWFNTKRFNWIYQQFDPGIIDSQQWRNRGDQDYIYHHLSDSVRFLDFDRIQSWRWQALDGGFDFVARKHRQPGAGTSIDSKTSVLVFHGTPKPHEVEDPVIKQYWS